MNDDKFTRQYDYKANSNLVLPSNTSLVDKRPSNEATGEVQSLVGRLVGKMGDKVRLRKPEVKDGTKKAKRSGSTKLKMEFRDPQNFSVADIEIKDLLYQPKTDITAKIYDLLIKFVRKQLGFQHSSIIGGATDEVICTMKDPNISEELRRSKIDGLLSSIHRIDDEDYNELCNLCKKINDWESNQTAEEESDDVGVIFVDDDDDSTDTLPEVRDSEDDELDLDEMFEKAEDEAVKHTLNLDELSKRETFILPKMDIPDPIHKEGYQEYNIMPKKRSNKIGKLILVEDLPEAERKALINIKSLNPIQSQIYKKAISSDDSLLICAPTGAGKTNIAILTMLREIIKCQKKEGSGFDIDKFKIIYVAPIKALVQEIVENLKQRLGEKTYYNLKVEELTGDHQLEQGQISRSQIIVCTPEKWDIVTRKSGDRLYTKVVKLVIFDEIHLLHNERGATLEALVARIKRHKQIEGEPIRIVGLSATLPNYEDVARFIAPHTTTFYFDGSYRPIPLKLQYIAMTETKKSFRMINDIVYQKVIERLVDNAQILIFVHSRSDTVKTAEYIRGKALEEEKLGLFLSSESAKDKINEYGHNLGFKLKELLQFGIGVHHAGLRRDERSCVEELYRKKNIKVLVSTATLAWGVNLPARVVIIKGTQLYRDGKWTELDSLDITQMLGRAGRPGFDKEGEGIVITQQSQVNFYMSLTNEQLPVESRLIGRLAEFINAECVVNNVESIEDAVEWLSETYLSSRMLSVMQSDSRQYMSMYGINLDANRNDPKLNNHKRNLAYAAVCMLDERGLIVYDRSSGAIRSTELGRIASHYNCSSRTIKSFHDSIHEYTSDMELFRIFSLADEFKDIYVRRGEEADLQSLINTVPFPIDDKRATPGANKVNALLQVYIIRMNIESSDLVSDMHFIKDNAARLSRAIHEIVMMKGYARVAALSLDLCRKIDQRMTICHSPLRQFADDLDPDIISRLEKKDYNIEELKVLRPDKLSELLRCDRNHGEKAHRFLKYLPKLKIEEASVKPLNECCLKVELAILPDFSWIDKYHLRTVRFWLHVEDVNQEKLLHYEMVHVAKRNIAEKIKVIFHIPYLTPVNPFYFIRIFPDNWFGCDQILPIELANLRMPTKSIDLTQLQDLEPERVSSLNNPLFQRAYEERGIRNFNQIQTHAFPHLYQSDQDLILLAFPGSGKTTCAELAVMRCISNMGSNSKIAFISANNQQSKIVYNNWIKIFNDHYGVRLLTGDRMKDAAMVYEKQTNIVIGDPETWQSLMLNSRGKYLDLVNRFHLFIFDQIHLLYDDNKSVLESLCSKIVYKLKANPEPEQTRMIALGSSMTGVDSLKKWLTRSSDELKKPILLHYDPRIRSVKLSVEKYRNHEYKMRLLTMQRPVYRHVIQTAKDKPTLIFVADYCQALDVCEALSSYSKSEGRRFGRSSINAEGLHETRLRTYLHQGIGYLYRGMHDEDLQLVTDLYTNNQIQIVVATVAMCWAIQCRSYLTIIMDTQYYNGFEASDYNLTDVMQMVGLTGRPLVDYECKCIIMCEFTKADYYERFLREPLPVESELSNNLITHVNYEIAHGSLKKHNDIFKLYLAFTFLNRRITGNPNYYGIAQKDSEQVTVFHNFYDNIAGKVVQELRETNFISTFGSDEDPDFECEPLSSISNELYICHETLKSYADWLRPNVRSIGTLELIELISSYTSEYDKVLVRYGELQALKSLQRRHCPRESDKLLSKSTIQNFKIKLLILSQYQETEDTIEGELNYDRLFIIKFAHRLLTAILYIADLNDSLSLFKTSIRLAKKIVPFKIESQPNLEMEISNVVYDHSSVTVDITITRENNPLSLEEFIQSNRLGESVYRDEFWYFLLHVKPPSDKPDQEHLVVKKQRPPPKGTKTYKVVEFKLTDEVEGCKFDLYLMSDVYSTKEDRMIPDICNQ